MPLNYDRITPEFEAQIETIISGNNTPQEDDMAVAESTSIDEIQAKHPGIKGWVRWASEAPWKEVETKLDEAASTRANPAARRSLATVGLLALTGNGDYYNLHSTSRLFGVDKYHRARIGRILAGQQAIKVEVVEE